MVHTTLPIRQIGDEYRVGASIKSLADKYSVSYGTIRNILAASNVPVRKPGRPSPATEARPIKAYQYRQSTAFESEAGKLPDTELNRLRQAIGWSEDWNEGS